MSGNSKESLLGQVVVPWAAFWKSHSNLKMPVAEPQHSKGIHTKISNVPCQGLKTHQGINASTTVPSKRSRRSENTYCSESGQTSVSSPITGGPMAHAPGFSTPEPPCFSSHIELASQPKYMRQLLGQ